MNFLFLEVDGVITDGNHPPLCDYHKLHILKHIVKNYDLQLIVTSHLWREMNENTGDGAIINDALRKHDIDVYDHINIFDENGKKDFVLLAEYMEQELNPGDTFVILETNKTIPIPINSPINEFLSIDASEGLRLMHLRLFKRLRPQAYHIDGEEIDVNLSKEEVQRLKNEAYFRALERKDRIERTKYRAEANKSYIYRFKRKFKRKLRFPN